VIIYANEAPVQERAGWTIPQIADALKNNALPINIGWHLFARDVQKVAVHPAQALICPDLGLAS
jgi:hypothetical protein